MKRAILSIILLSSFSLIAQDSKIDITPYAGYTFSGSPNYYQADVKMKDASSYGLTIDLRLSRSSLVELMYNVIPTSVNSTIYYGGVLGDEFRDTPINVEYYHIGGMQELSTEKVRPYTVVSLGGTRFSSTGETSVNQGGSTYTETFSDLWAFSVALGGGAKIMFSDRIGLRLGARLLMPMYFSGIGIYCGNGCGGGATFGLYFLQLDLTGGLVIGLGEY